MKKVRLLLVAIMFGLAFSNAAAEVFSDNFDDGDISDWTVTVSGNAVFEVSNEEYVSPPYSVHMQSTGNYRAMGASPSYALNLAADYEVAFDFLLPHSNNHWFEVFNNHQVYLVIDGPTGLSWYKAGQPAQLIMTLNTNQWYRIEIKVHPSTSSYDVYVDGQFKQTCPFWIHTGFEDTFRIGDRADGSTDRGEAYWDNIIITQEPDSDEDGVPDANDNCPYDYNPDQNDLDADGIGDECDYCPGTPNGMIVSDIGCPIGDLDGDTDVDFLDLSIFAWSWSSEPGHPRWNPDCDISVPPDNYIDTRDLGVLLDSWPVPLSSQWYAILIGAGTKSWMITSLKHGYNVVSDSLSYDDDHIYFVANQQYDYSGSHYYYSSKANIQSAINDLRSRTDSDDSVFVYLIGDGYDHAGGKFDVSSTGEVITGDELDGWLDAMSYAQMIVVMDTCWCQNFEDSLTYDNNNPHKKRILITSTGKKNKMWEATPDSHIFDEANCIVEPGSDPNPWDEGAEFSSSFFEAFYMTDTRWMFAWMSYLSPYSGPWPQGPPSWYPMDLTRSPYLVADTDEDGMVSVYEAFVYSCRVDEFNPTLANGSSNPYWNGDHTSQPHIWSALDDGYDDGIDPDDTCL